MHSKTPKTSSKAQKTNLKKTHSLKKSPKYSQTASLTTTTKSNKLKTSTPITSSRPTQLHNKSRRTFSTADDIAQLQESFALIAEIQTNQQVILKEIQKSQKEQNALLAKIFANAGNNQLLNAYIPGRGEGPEKDGKLPTAFVVQPVKYAPVYQTPPEDRLNEVLTRLVLQSNELQAELTGLTRTLYPSKAPPGWTPPPKTIYSTKTTFTKYVPKTTSTAEEVPVGHNDMESASAAATKPQQSQTTSTTTATKPKIPKTDTYIVKPDPRAVPELLFSIPQADV